MKKLIIALAALTMGLTLSAQSKSIGGRLNGLFGFGIEVEYQHYMQGENFLNIGADLLAGRNSFGFCAACIYDFTFAKAGVFDFYAGPGLAVVGIFGENKIFEPGIVGNIGAQWNITDHFALSLDLRPGFYFYSYKDADVRVTGTEANFTNLGLGIKYCW